MYIFLNCMPVLRVYNWKCRQKVLCTRKFMLARCIRYDFIEHSCENIKWMNRTGIHVLSLSAFMKWSRYTTVHLRLVPSKSNWYSKPWNPLPFFGLYEYFSCQYTHTYIYQAYTGIYISFRKQFVPSLDKPEKD